MEDSILSIDVNEIIKKDVKSLIDNYKKQLDTSIDNSRKLTSKINKMKRQLKSSKSEIFLIDHLRDTYKSMKNDFDKLEFIMNILGSMFKIVRKFSYRINDCSFRFGTELAVNYYDHKDVVINILEVLDQENTSVIDEIKYFKMPYDYDKEDVIEYVKQPRYNTNGKIYGVSEYWIEGKAGKTNMPHDLIMQNPHILEDDVFEILINTIRSCRDHAYYLFALPTYNTNISKGQIALLGECLSSIPERWLGYDVVDLFIKKNLYTNFNERTLNFLYHKITTNNCYRTFHMENFPIEFQIKFLLSRPFPEVYKILSSDSCRWSDVEKEKFLSTYFNNKNIDKKFKLK